MQVTFLSSELKELCESERLQKRKLGAPGAKLLRSRLADLEAAANVRELVAGRPHPLKQDRAGQYAVRLDGGRRLVLEPAVETPPVLNDGSVDWARVTAVRIVFIGDYHD